MWLIENTGDSRRLREAIGSIAGGFHAFDARSGERLFLHETPRPVSASPLTYQVNGKQYVSVVSVDTVLTFALR